MTTVQRMNNRRLELARDAYLAKPSKLTLDSYTYWMNRVAS